MQDANEFYPKFVRNSSGSFDVYTTELPTEVASDELLINPNENINPLEESYVYVDYADGALLLRIAASEYNVLTLYNTTTGSNLDYQFNYSGNFPTTIDKTQYNFYVPVQGTPTNTNFQPYFVPTLDLGDILLDLSGVLAAYDKETGDLIWGSQDWFNDGSPEFLEMYLPIVTKEGILYFGYSGQYFRVNVLTGEFYTQPYGGAYQNILPKPNGDLISFSATTTNPSFLIHWNGTSLDITQLSGAAENHPRTVGFDHPSRNIQHSLDGTKYVTTSGTAVRIWDTDTDALLHEITIDNWYRGNNIMVSKDTGLMYIDGYTTAQQLYEINPDDGTFTTSSIDADLPDGFWFAMMSPDGKKIFADDGWNGQAIIDLDTKTVTQTPLKAGFEKDYTVYAIDGLSPLRIEQNNWGVTVTDDDTLAIIDFNTDTVHGFDGFADERKGKLPSGEKPVLTATTNGVLCAAYDVIYLISSEQLDYDAAGKNTKFDAGQPLTEGWYLKGLTDTWYPPYYATPKHVNESYPLSGTYQGAPGVYYFGYRYDLSFYSNVTNREVFGWSGGEFNKLFDSVKDNNVDKVSGLANDTFWATNTSNRLAYYFDDTTKAWVALGTAAPQYTNKYNNIFGDGTNIYQFGGYLSTAARAAGVVKWDGAAWTTLPRNPEDATDVRIVFAQHGDYVYSYNRTTLNMYRFSLTGETWELLSPQNTGNTIGAVNLVHEHGVVWNDNIYFMEDLVVYNVSSDSWSTLIPQDFLAYYENTFLYIFDVGGIIYMAGTAYLGKTLSYALPGATTP